MATRAAYKRLTTEYKSMQESPPPYIQAIPDESNILEWHYLITGPPDTPYEGGQYHGTLTFPPDYPYKPPAIRMTTPSGRFKCNMRLCLSISDYHPKTWNPAWSVSTILTGLLSFMVSDDPTAGSTTSSEAVKRELAAKSEEWNATANPKFQEHFPELVEEYKKKRAAGAASAAVAAAPARAASVTPDVTNGAAATAGPVASAPPAAPAKGNRSSVRNWFSRTNLLCAMALLFGWMVAARIME